MFRLRLRQASEAAVFVIAACATQAWAQTRGELHSGIVISAPTGNLSGVSPESDQILQLDVFMNGRSLNLVAAFTLRQDGTISSSRTELEAIGLRVPQSLASDVEIPLNALPGVSYRYDEAAQAVHFTASANALMPTLIKGRQTPSVPEPARPPLGGTVNYTLFAGADKGPNGLHFQDLSGEFETRAFGTFGLVENSFIGRVGDGSGVIRLDSSYTYEDPGELWTAKAGDLISGGFSWTRPIRMFGIQIHRDFDLRPDLITMPLPTLTGTAAAASTLDLYINQVRTLSTSVPQGPYAIENPPIIFGGGQAQVVTRDALGRETVSTTPFYASPDLLAPGLTDYSAEIGFARRNYGAVSNDYDGDLAFSGSYRRGIASWLTLQGHGEATTSLVSLGGGGVFNMFDLGLVSLAASGSHTPDGSGALFDFGFESRLSFFSILLRAQRTLGDYEDLASWTAEVPSGIGITSDRRLFNQPKALDQAAISSPLPWSGSSIGASYVHISENDGVRSSIVGLSFTQDLGRLSFFANATRDFDRKGSTFLFVGLSIPLGGGVTGSVGATAGHGANAGYVEASQQSTNDPGTFNWSARASEGQQTEAYGIARYNTSFAKFEGTGLYSDGTYSATAMMEGAVSTVAGQGLYATQRLDNAFALVDVGAPGVTILRENRNAGVTDAEGTLLVPNLVPFVANRIAIDPSGLPVDAQITETEATVTPFSRAASLVDLRVKTNTRSALVLLVDPQSHPIELGSLVRIEGVEDEFVIGYDGLAYLDNLKDQNIVLVTTPDDATCRAEFSYAAEPGEQVRIGPAVCSPVQ